MKIVNIQGREILDSRGNPTVEADVILSNGIMGRASVPSGSSVGSREACELRDRDEKRYAGRGVRRAIQHINQDINEALCGFAVSEQEKIDNRLNELDGSLDKSKLGANAILAVSLASARAYANSSNQPLYLSLHKNDFQMVMPVPLMNILNGGAHADNNIDIQEFMILPVGAPDFSSALQMGAEVLYALKSQLKQQGLHTAVGDEGGVAPNLHSNRHALDLIAEVIQHAGFKLGQEVVLALDVAASELFNNDVYYLASENQALTREELIDYYAKLIADYPIVSIEDGLDEHDQEGWRQLTARLGKQIQLVGDDLFVTNSRILQEGIELNMANAILIKPNQIGTLTETMQTIRLAQHNAYRCIMSHRSGETEDTFIADLAVACGCGQIKTGAPCRSDRVAKYNQLLRIDEVARLPYAGKAILI